MPLGGSDLILGTTGLAFFEAGIQVPSIPHNRKRPPPSAESPARANSRFGRPKLGYRLCREQVLAVRGRLLGPGLGLVSLQNVDLNPFHCMHLAL